MKSQHVHAPLLDSLSDEAGSEEGVIGDFSLE